MTVLALHWRLKSLGFNPSLWTVNGQRGPKTIAAVKAVQKAYGLVVDGRCKRSTMCRGRWQS